MNAGIRDIFIISMPADTPRFQDLLGDVHQFGVNLQYAAQPSTDGLAQTFIIVEEFIGDELSKTESCITYADDIKENYISCVINIVKSHNKLVWLPETKFADDILWYLDNSEYNNY